jgi:hypothetical protein
MVTNINFRALGCLIYVITQGADMRAVNGYDNEQLTNGIVYPYDNIPTEALKTLLDGILQVDPANRISLFEVRELFEAWVQEE